MVGYECLAESVRGECGATSGGTQQEADASQFHQRSSNSKIERNYSSEIDPADAFFSSNENNSEIIRVHVEQI